jgi:hypothetical protein
MQHQHDTPMFQPVTDGSSIWKCRRQTQQTDRGTQLDFRIKSVHVLTLCEVLGEKVEIRLNVSHRKLNFYEDHFSLV